jgi:hypothetical protein
MVTTPRIRMMHALCALILAGLLGSPSAVWTQAQEATPSAGAASTPTPFTDQVFTGQGFVGEVEVADLPSGQAFVAAVIAEPKPGEELRAVRVLLYGDRENQIREWFTGEVTGDRLELVSEGGAQLDGTWSREGMTGTISLPEGILIPVDAVPISGIGGLYTVQVLPDGSVQGTSEAAVKLAGQVAPEPGPDAGYPLRGTLTPPDGPSPL